MTYNFRHLIIIKNNKNKILTNIQTLKLSCLIFAILG